MTDISNIVTSYPYITASVLLILLGLHAYLKMRMRLTQAPDGTPLEEALGFTGTIDRYGSWQEVTTHFQLKEYPERVFSITMGSNGDHRSRNLHHSMLRLGDQVSFKVTAKMLRNYQVAQVFDFENHSYKGPALQ